MGFLNGKDDDLLVAANLQEPLAAIRSGYIQQPLLTEKKILAVMPCDMSTHNSITDAAHLTCFRCGNGLHAFRVMFEMRTVNGETIADIAKELDCDPLDLCMVNSGAKPTKS